MSEKKMTLRSKSMTLKDGSKVTIEYEEGFIHSGSLFVTTKSGNTRSYHLESD